MRTDSSEVKKFLLAETIINDVLLCSNNKQAKPF
jgi:hypothetical protein